MRRKLNMEYEKSSTWGILLVVVLLHTIRVYSSGFKMITVSHRLRLSPGESVQLGCEFHAEKFNLFDNPVLWRKSQRGEQVQINMMGNLLEPFVSARRFSVSFLSQRGDHTLWLAITDLSPEDNGDYTCEVHGPNNVILVNVTHRVIVGDEIDLVLLTNKNATPVIDVWPYPAVSASSTSAYSEDEPLSEDEEQETEIYEDDVSVLAPIGEVRRHRSLVYTESQPGTLRCLAVGNAPVPPLLSLIIGRSEVTADFRSSTRSLIVGGQVGLRLIRYVVELWRHDFRPNVTDRGKLVMCSVHSAHDRTVINATSSRLVMNYAPIIHCEPGDAYLNEVDIYLHCEIHSRPQPSYIYWIVDHDDGIVVTDQEKVGDYHVLILLHTNGVFESQLYLARVSADSFRSYELVVQNSIATRRQFVQLIQKFRPSSSQQVINSRGEAPQSDNDEFDESAYATSSSATNALHHYNYCHYNCCPLRLFLCILVVVVVIVFHSCNHLT